VVSVLLSGAAEGWTPSKPDEPAGQEDGQQVWLTLFDPCLTLFDFQGGMLHATFIALRDLL
jgi:hypothetical protein